jgi:hypothetical protein
VASEGPSLSLHLVLMALLLKAVKRALRATVSPGPAAARAGRQPPEPGGGPAKAPAPVPAAAVSLPPMRPASVNRCLTRNLNVTSYGLRVKTL